MSETKIVWQALELDSAGKSEILPIGPRKNGEFDSQDEAEAAVLLYLSKFAFGQRAYVVKTFFRKSI